MTCSATLFEIYDAEAIFALRDIMLRRLTGCVISEEQARRMVAEEIALTQGADAVLAVSSDEKRIFEEHGVGRVHILGHSVPAQPGATPFAERHGFLFVGALHSDNSPNADSLRWFAAKVLPRLRQRIRPGPAPRSGRPLRRALDLCARWT